MTATPLRSVRRSVAACLSLTMALLVAGALSIANTTHAQPAPAAPSMSDEASTGMQTIAYAALSGYDEVMADLGFIGGLMGRPEGVQMIEGTIAMFTQGRGLVGFDKSRPIGVMVQTDGADVAPLVCLPVNDLDATLELVSGFGFMPADVGGGVTELELPDQTIYLKPEGQWTYVAQNQSQLDDVPNDPSPVLAKLVNDYDIAVQAMVQRVPAEVKEEFVNAMQEGMQQGLEQMPDETDEQHEMRVNLAEVQVEQIVDMINGLDKVMIGWNIDSEKGTTNLDFAVTALPESLMGMAFKSYDDPQSSLQGFHREGAAMSMIGSAKNPPEVVEMQREQLEAMISMFRKQIDNAIDEQEEIELTDAQRDTLKSAGADLMDVYESMVYADASDMGASINYAEGGLSLIAGATNDEPKKLESALKKLVQVLEELPESAEVEWDIEWDADSHADVAMHTLAFPLPDEAWAAEPLLGDVIELTLGVGTDKVYMAAGPNGVSDLKRAIDSSASNAGPLEHPLEMLLSVKQLIELALPYAEEEAAPVMEMLLEAFEGEDADKITARILRLDGGALFRYEIESGVLKAIGAAAAQAAAQAQGAGGGF